MSGDAIGRHYFGGLLLSLGHHPDHLSSESKFAFSDQQKTNLLLPAYQPTSLPAYEPGLPLLQRGSTIAFHSSREVVPSLT